MPNHPKPRKKKHNNSPKPSEPNITQTMVQEISRLTLDGLQGYEIRKMVDHAQAFGPYLKNQRLETNQIRKFLDAVNRIKVRQIQEETRNEDSDSVFTALKTDIVLLKPKLAYAAARQSAAKPLNEVMSVAVDCVHSLKDFERLIQLIESIIAYHKAEGGK